MAGGQQTNGETRRVAPLVALPAALALVAVLAAGVALWASLRGPFGQDPAYHGFADQRPLLGIPHCLNVVSNVPFLLVGARGLAFLLGPAARRPGGPFQGPAERWPFVVFFLGVGLTGVGSAYYHLDPTNGRLVWDRLPMAVAFMGLFAAVLDDRAGPRVGLRLLPVLVAAGLASVLYWHRTEGRGAGDLRPYYLVQYGTMLTLPALMLLLPPRYTAAGTLVAALGWYAVAKVCEHPLDGPIFDRLGWVSGHTLKHLAAAAATYYILRWVKIRVPSARGPG